MRKQGVERPELPSADAQGRSPDARTSLEGLRNPIARMLFERGRGVHDAATWDEAGEEMQDWLRGHADAMLALVEPEFAALQSERDELREIARLVAELQHDDGGRSFPPRSLCERARQALTPSNPQDGSGGGG